MIERVNVPSDILRNQAECFCDPQSKFPNLQITVEENRINLNTIQQILHIIGHLNQLGDFSLVLRIDGIQLLVDAVQFFVGALKFLVGCDEFLIG